MKKILLAITSLAIFGALIASCGKSTSSANQTTPVFVKGMPALEYYRQFFFAQGTSTQRYVKSDLIAFKNNPNKLFSITRLDLYENGTYNVRYSEFVPISAQQAQEDPSTKRELVGNWTLNGASLTLTNLGQIIDSNYQDQATNTVLSGLQLTLDKDLVSPGISNQPIILKLTNQ